MKILAALLALLVFTGCATTVSKQELAAARFDPIPKDYQTKIQNYEAPQLLDPYSAKYIFSEPRRGVFQDGALRGGKKHFGYIVATQLNAKNAFGAYTGSKQSYFFFFEGGAFMDATEYFGLLCVYAP